MGTGLIAHANRAKPFPGFTEVGLAPKTYRYRSRRSDDGELRRRLRQLAAERRRFGYRRLLIR